MKVGPGDFIPQMFFLFPVFICISVVEPAIFLLRCWIQSVVSSPGKQKTDACRFNRFAFHSDCVKINWLLVPSVNLDGIIWKPSVYESWKSQYLTK